MSKVSGRSGHRWRELRKRLRAELPPVCSICGGYIDRALTYPDPWSWTLDHALSLADFPELAEAVENLRPAHKRCNERKGRGGTPDPPRASRKWGA